MKDNDRNFELESPFLVNEMNTNSDSVILEFKERFDSPLTNNYIYEGPFSTTYQSEAGQSIDPKTERFVELRAELHNHQFNELLYELMNEVQERFGSNIASEMPQYQNQLELEAFSYYLPHIAQVEEIFDRMSNELQQGDYLNRSNTELEQFLDRFTWEGETDPASPPIQQFFGKVVNFAKKAIKKVGSLMPTTILFNKLKKLVRPLIKRVIKTAINKLPAAVRPIANKLADKLTKFEVMTVADNENPPSSLFVPAHNEINEIQNWFVDEVVNTALGNGELSYEVDFEAEIEKQSQQENALVTLDNARQKFIQELQNLNDGESAEPAIQNFLPALMAILPAVKIGIKVIGRDKVVNFLAGLVAKLISQFVGKGPAKLLSRSMVDVGMGLIGLETADQNNLGYEAIANTVQETLQNSLNQLATMPEDYVSDFETIENCVKENFESSAAANFPDYNIKQELREVSNSNTAWQMLPLSGRKQYKKLSKVYDVTLDYQKLSCINTFGGRTIASFLNQTMGIDLKKAPVKAKMHIYEAIPGTWLSKISLGEKGVYGLGTAHKAGWIQIHPLTKLASAVLVQEPCLAKPVPIKFLNNHNQIAVGQRFYYFEIPGSKVITIPTSGSKPTVTPATPPAPLGQSDIQAVLNFLKSEISFNYYFGQVEAQQIAEKLNQGDVISLAQTIRKSFSEVLSRILLRNIGDKIKIIHEAYPEMFLNEMENPREEQLAPIGAMAMAALKKAIEELISKFADYLFKAVENYFKARRQEFITAQRASKNGVTVKIIFTKIPFMAKLRAMLKILREGKNVSLGDIKDLISLPSISNLIPEIKIVPNKQFD
ncbi:hypothetical protein [Runella limosa]|uniref:hypothetical protein n=1 Tax=Runella limosa TaxID=370978 RepID=UPI00041B5AA5|nr:hypothetical protein [Runella limosa]